MKSSILVVLVLVFNSVSSTGISQEVLQKNVDLNLDGIVDFQDYSILAQYWLQNVVWP